MNYRRMPIEVESPEQLGYGRIAANLAESSVTDVVLKSEDFAFDQLVLCYGDHLGKPELRRLIADEAEELDPDDVLLTPGAAGALFIVNTSLLRPGDHMIVVHPNYATNIETPRAIGCEVESLELRFEDGFRLDTSRLAAMIRPNTRLVSLTTPHNPSGTVIGENDLREIVRIVEHSHARLLLDETYRDLSFSPPPPLAAAMSERAISVSSVSKALGLPGVRIGWLVCRDRELMETLLAAKEQISICNSVVDEEIAWRFMARKTEHLSLIGERTHRNFEILKAWIAEEKRMEWVEPQGGVVCFPRIRESAGIDMDGFYRVLFDDYATLVGPGHWFEMERRYMRIGFGWPGEREFRQGLENISRALDQK